MGSTYMPIQIMPAEPQTFAVYLDDGKYFASVAPAWALCDVEGLSKPYRVVMLLAPGAGGDLEVAGEISNYAGFVARGSYALTGDLEGYSKDLLVDDPEEVERVLGELLKPVPS